MNTLKENTMVIKALEVFRHNTGLEADIQYGIGPADGMLRIGYQNRELFFAVETKARVNKTDIGILAQQAARQPERTIIITQYINPKIAEKMNRMDLPFIDTAGNVYVKDLPLYIYIKGNKPAEKLYQTPLLLYSSLVYKNNTVIIYHLMVCIFRSFLSIKFRYCKLLHLSCELPCANNVIIIQYII